MEQLKNILALRLRLENGAVVEIPRENPLIMMPDHTGDVLIVRLAETSGVQRTLETVEPAHDVVAVVEGNYIHWCVVTMDEIAEFIEGNANLVVQNGNLFLRRALDGDPSLRPTLPYPIADNLLCVAEVGCDLSIDPASGALLSSRPESGAGRLVSARLLFVTNFERESGMWSKEDVSNAITRKPVRANVSNEEVLRTILAPQQSAPTVITSNPRGAPQKVVQIPVPSSYVVATLQIDENMLNEMSDMAVLSDGRHVIYQKDGTPVDVLPLIWHAISAVKSTEPSSPEVDTVKVNKMFSAPNLADVTVTESDVIYEGLEFGYMDLNSGAFVLVTNEFDKNVADNTDAKILVSGFDFYVLVALAEMKPYGTVFINSGVIASGRVSFAKGRLKIEGYGSVFNKPMPTADASNLIDDIRALNTSL